MVPELRAQRLHEIAARVLGDFGGDLKNLFARPEREIRKELKKFPGIGDPGADRIRLFSGSVALPAIPSNCPHVLVRLSVGQEPDNYSAVYRTAKEILHAALPETVEARRRAYLLLKMHGEEICTRKPKCSRCPLSATCAFAMAAGSARESASI
jgi:adenine-specific DNA glycosylase